ncbi:Protein CHROMATIN REMODELING 24 [Raphanus sativus]|uniref:Protein CHROMATIN REMODELING 24 n=1 Tax=Raphanus sativus TaxID=3726 RepID=A0A6J0NLM7_RAPSA|nr:protein CHROMATIN REMODELING 24 [Raphanus sativus]KAJ4897321.1 Protein CHROMATIN REMODELING 24 [Raphanus sativus]
MAENTASTRRKPQSLNDRHYRLLQDLSAPPKHAPPPSSSSTHEEDEGTKIKLAGRRRLCKASVKHDASDEDDDPDLADFDSPGKGDASLERAEARNKFTSWDEEPKEAKTEVGDFPSFSMITDFGSPSPQLEQREGRQGGGGQNEIMDILDDLTYKLGTMSIKKKRDGLSSDFGPAQRHSNDFESFKPSFSLVSDLSESSSSDVVTASKAGADSFNDRRGNSGFAIREEKASNVFSGERGERVTDVGKQQPFTGQHYVVKSEGYRQEYNLDRGKDKLKEVDRSLKTSRHVEVSEKLRSVGRSNAAKLRDLDDDEDDEDCVVLTGKKAAVVKSHLEKPKKPVRSHNTATHAYEEKVSEDEGSITFTGPKSSYTLRGKIATILYPHQREGLKWLWSLHIQEKGGILGDDMGLGKTMQICSFLAGLFHSKLIKRALVVAPKTLLPHWMKELATVGLSQMTREYYGTSVKARQYDLNHILQGKGVLLTTYDIVRNNTKALQGYQLFTDDDDDIKWDYMILDEGHLIKNPSTQRAKSLLEIPSSHRIIISGTPIQNNLKELWALFNFSCPGLLGDKKWFKDNYEHYIIRGTDKNASDREQRIGSTVAKNLREHIQPFFLRRLKSEVFGDDDATTAKLSKKDEIVVWLRLTACQRQIYEAFLNSEIVLSAFDGSPLAALTILKKICDHPLLLTKRAAEDVLEGMESTLTPEEAGVAERLAMHIADNVDTDDFQTKNDSISCKLSFIMSLLENLIAEGHRVLIFSQTRKMLNLIQDSLTSNGYSFLRIDGTTKAPDRLKTVEEFQSGHVAPIFLLTSQVGGLGLTLTKADRVIVVDPAWNPSTDNQSVDRAYRIGQTKDVIVYRLMTSATVEEKIYRKQVYKGGLFKTATEHKEQIRYFSQQDLRELFSLPKGGFDVSPTQQQLYEEHYNQIKLDEFLESHVKFLETLGIAGVSHHSLLFSKTAPIQPIQQDEVEEIRRGTTSYFGGPSAKPASSSQDNVINGAEYAFKPKDVKVDKKINISPIDASELSESDIKARISRLSMLFENKSMVASLPDRGAKIQKQIAELTRELGEMKAAQSKDISHQVIDLEEDISQKMHRGLNL